MIGDTSFLKRREYQAALSGKREGRWPLLAITGYAFFPGKPVDDNVGAPMLGEQEIESCYPGQFILVNHRHNMLMDDNRVGNFKAAIE